MASVRRLELGFGSMVLGWSLATSSSLGQEGKDAGLPLFREQIRPLLLTKCLQCHNPEKKKGGLDLSQRSLALKGGKNGPAFDPKEPGKSLLLEKVAEGQMPPQNPLSAKQVAAFKQWLEAGAPYEQEPLVLQRAGADWWSLQPVGQPALPKSPFDHLSSNPIDRFLFAALDKNGLKPAPPAAPISFLRRLTVDLTGLPPTPEEIAEFIADCKLQNADLKDPKKSMQSAAAIAKVVDRLLASPAYGERWGRHWLDVVRFGESHGYEQNHLRANAWPYRDYVIRAFNEDKPYDQFIREQLAGDLVGAGNPKVEVATGFLVAGVHDTVGIQTEEGTRQQRANDLDDMVSATGATFLGLTINCARCHDHKFDPILQKDYYRMTAVVAGVRHAERSLAKKGPAAPDKNLVQLRRLQGELNDLMDLARTQTLRRQGMNPVPRPAVNVRRNVEDFPPLEARFLRLTLMATKDGAEPCLDEIEIFGPGSPDNLALGARGAKASASSLLPGYPIHQIAHLNDGRYGNDWSWISNQRGQGQATIELPHPEKVSRVVWSRDSEGDKARFQDRLAAKYRLEASLDGKTWRLLTSDADRAAAPESISLETLVQALSQEQRQRRETLTAALGKLGGMVPGKETTGTAYVGQFTAPDPIYLLKRGDVMQRDELVTPAGLSQLPGLNADLDIDPKLGEPGRRLALANWIASPKNPLTARVLVNRLWHHHFGQGIVATPSDFGYGGAKPAHPELLDWLARDFMDQGWTMKRLHKLIVTSYTYRQASAAAADEGMAKDAGNRLLWRMPLRRMEGEALRDAILAVSGKLDRTMGGPGYRLFKYRVVNIAIYDPLEEHGPETWRRGVYQQAARAYRDNLLANFDCPECAQQAPRREITTTPLQALSLLNGSFTQQQAEFFADRVRKEAGPDTGKQVARAFHLALGRAPTVTETMGARELIERRGLVNLCRALMNANEFVYY